MRARTFIAGGLITALLGFAPAQAAGFLDFLSGGGFSAYDGKNPGDWLTQIDAKAKFPKPYAPEPTLLGAFTTASLGPEVAYAITTYHTDFVTAADAQNLCQDIVDRLLAGWKGTA